jgi:hypothetical protein
MRMSHLNYRFMFGFWIFMATVSPDFRVALWTWAMEAEATGVSEIY